MSSPSDYNVQLGDLTAKLAGMVAERLAWATRGTDPNKRRQILEMIEGQLPDIIANSIAKSPSLHSAKGVEYFEKNIESMAESYVQKFVGKI
mgnify:FL=1